MMDLADVSEKRRETAAYLIGSGAPVFILSSLEIVRELLDQDNPWFDTITDSGLFLLLLGIGYYQHFYQENPLTVNEMFSPGRTLFALAALNTFFFYALHYNTVSSWVDPESADFQAIMTELGIFAIAAGVISYQFFKPLYDNKYETAVFTGFLTSLFAFTIICIMIDGCDMSLNLFTANTFSPLEALGIECGMGGILTFSGLVLRYNSITSPPAPAPAPAPAPLCPNASLKDNEFIITIYPDARPL